MPFNRPERRTGIQSSQHAGSGVAGNANRDALLPVVRQESAEAVRAARQEIVPTGFGNSVLATHRRDSISDIPVFLALYLTSRPFDFTLETTNLRFATGFC